MKDERKPAVGYVRMSTNQQQDSPARQRQDIEALAQRQGFRIIRWYEDHGQTGTESSKRREFQKLLADAKAGNVPGSAALGTEPHVARRHLRRHAALAAVPRRRGVDHHLPARGTEVRQPRRRHHRHR